MASSILLLIVAFMVHNKKSSIYLIIMLAAVSLPALLWNAGSGIKGFILKYIIILIAEMILVSNADKLAKRHTENKASRSSEKALARALAEKDFQLAESTYLNNPVCLNALSSLNDPGLICAFMDYLGKSNRMDKNSYRSLAAFCTDDKRIVEMMNDRENNLSFRACLFEAYCGRNGDSGIRDRVDLLIDLAPVSDRAKSVLFQIIPTINDPDMLKKALHETDALNNSEVIGKTMPMLTYPEFAEELRHIAANLKVHSLAIRKQAFEKLPQDDIARKKKYCPFCGSTEIINGYLGLISDMSHYGYKCQSCGHSSGAPEGMGEGKDFSVSLETLCKYASPEIALKNG